MAAGCNPADRKVHGGSNPSAPTIYWKRGRARSIATDSKSVDPPGSAGSNPAASAMSYVTAVQQVGGRLALFVVLRMPVVEE